MGHIPVCPGPGNRGVSALGQNFTKMKNVCKNKDILWVKVDQKQNKATFFKTLPSFATITQVNMIRYATG